MASRDDNDVCCICDNHLLDPYMPGAARDKQWKILFDCGKQEFHCICHQECLNTQRLEGRNAKCLACGAARLRKSIVVKNLNDLIFVGNYESVALGKNCPVFSYLPSEVVAAGGGPRLTAPRIYASAAGAAPEQAGDDSGSDVSDSLITRGRGRGRSRGRGRGRGRGGSSPAAHGRQSRSRSGGRTDSAVPRISYSPEPSELTRDDPRSAPPSPGDDPNRSPTYSSPRNYETDQESSEDDDALVPAAAAAQAPAAAAFAAAVAAVAAAAAAPAAPAAAVAAAAAAAPEVEFVDLTSMDSLPRHDYPLLTAHNYEELLSSRLNGLMRHVSNTPAALSNLVAQLVCNTDSKYDNVVEFFGTVIVNSQSQRIQRWNYIRQGKERPTVQPQLISTEEPRFIAEIEDARFITEMERHINDLFTRIVRSINSNHTGNTTVGAQLVTSIYNVTRARSIKLATELMQSGEYKTPVHLINHLARSVYEAAEKTLGIDIPALLQRNLDLEVIYNSQDKINYIQFRGLPFGTYFPFMSARYAFEIVHHFITLDHVDPVTNVGRLQMELNSETYLPYLSICDVFVQRYRNAIRSIDIYNQQMGCLLAEYDVSHLRRIEQLLCTIRHHLRAYEMLGERHEWPICGHVLPKLTDSDLRDDQKVKETMDLHCALCQCAILFKPSTIRNEDGTTTDIESLELPFACTHVFHTSCMEKGSLPYCPVCKNEMKRRDTDGSEIKIAIKAADLINAQSDEAKRTFARIQRLAKIPFQPRVLTQEEIAQKERELRDAEERARINTSYAQQTNKRDRAAAEARLLARMEKQSANANPAQTDDGPARVKRRRLDEPVAAGAASEPGPAKEAEPVSAPAKEAESVSAPAKEAESVSAPAAAPATAPAAAPATAPATAPAAAPAAGEARASPAAHHGPRPEISRLMSLLADGSDVTTAAPRLRAPRAGDAKPKLAIDAVIPERPGTTKILRSLRKYLKILVKLRRGEPTKLPVEGFDFYYNEDDILSFVRDFRNVVETIHTLFFDVTDVSSFVEKVMAQDEGACAELLAICERIDAGGAGGGDGA